VCLEECVDQARLSNHVWKHKLHHLCYRCGIGYRNKADILKHLFWKHGTEGVLCKRCLQKKWPHVYHFCVPPVQFVCEVCQATFNRSVALKVHRRLHSGDAKYPCTEDGCEKRFISKKLLLKHVHRHDVEKVPIDANMEEGHLSTVDEEAHDAKVEDSLSAMYLEGTSKAVALKTELPANDDDALENVGATSSKTSTSDGKCDGDANDRLEEEEAEKRTIKMEEKDELPESGKVHAAEDNKEQVAEDFAGKETAKDRVSDEAATIETSEVSIPVKKSKKKRKAKDDDKSVVDLMNLPALNLSESDSSDDSDNENSSTSFNSRRFMDVTETTEPDNQQD
uniref:C2H2-type domain-containing protein n=1 Tax=Anopheles maculatus TaxID=74869 RepID=A0A182SZW1_9DIPT